MYKNLLVATDGSEYALKAAKHGLDLAQALSAKVTVITVTERWSSIALSEIAVGLSEEGYADRAAEYAGICLARVEDEAKQRGLICDMVHLSGPLPYDAIIKTATERGIDLIVVGGHGHRGMIGLLLGSETTKILTHCKLPVLVYRE